MIFFSPSRKPTFFPLFSRNSLLLFRDLITWSITNAIFTLKPIMAWYLCFSAVKPVLSQALGTYKEQRRARLDF